MENSAFALTNGITANHFNKKILLFVIAVSSFVHM